MYKGRTWNQCQSGCLWRENLDYFNCVFVVAYLYYLILPQLVCIARVYFLSPTLAHDQVYTKETIVAKIKGVYRLSSFFSFID